MLASIAAILMLLLFGGFAFLNHDWRDDGAGVASEEQSSTPAPAPPPAPKAESAEEALAPVIATPSTAAPIPEPVPVPVPAPSKSLCPSGSVDFSVYASSLVPLYGADGAISGYGAAAVVTAANNTSVAVRIESQVGAWGLDAAGNRVVPVATDWGMPTSNVLPRTQVSASGQNRFVTPEQGALVTRWVSNAMGYVTVNWLDVQPIDCPARPTVTG